MPKGVKREAVSEFIIGLAKRYGANAQLPGVRELAKSLKVSTATLDRVLGDLELRGVLLCHHGRGIFVSPTVGRLTIGFVFGGDVFASNASPFWVQILDIARDLAERDGYNFRYYLDIPGSRGATPTHGDLERDLQESRLDAVLTMAVSPEQMAWLEKWKQPKVALGTSMPDKYTVFMDTTAFIKAGLDQLAKYGCKRIAILGVSTPADAIITAMNSRGLAYDRALHYDYTWIAGLVNHENFEHFAYGLIRKVFRMARPDGLLIFDDTMARGAFVALLAEGAHPGRDVFIAALANKGSSVLVPYAESLTLVENDAEQLVTKAFKMAAGLMRGEEPPERQVIIKPTLRLRR